MDQRILTWGLWICTIMFFPACDCVQEVYGKILDEQTGQPIEKAFIQKAEQPSRFTYSDSLGNFNLSAISGGFRRCPPMKILITKAGYEIESISALLRDTTTVKLQKIE